MMEKILYFADYYLNVIIALCGFDGSAGNDAIGWVIVAIALVLVIGAFYIAISKAIWPGESDPTHIKYQILEDNEEIDHAH